MKKPKDFPDSELVDRLEVALDAAGAAAWSVDLRTNVAWRSENHDSLFGYPERLETWTQDTFVAHVIPEDREKVIREIRGAGLNFRSECRILRAGDQQVRWLEVQGRTLNAPNQQPRALIGIVKDITDIKKMESQLVQAAKMSSLGEMAGGMAHEINTPLGGIALLTDLLQEDLESGSSDYALLVSRVVEIRKTVDRLAKIVSGLRSFSRTLPTDPMVRTPISEIIEDTLDLCRSKLHSRGIEVRRIGQAAEEVECHPPQISQVLLNLINNSCDAVEALDEKWIEISVATVGPKITLSVTDSGSGIDTQIAEKMMQPFFTTKEIGKGMGLGLSISKGILEEHQGGLRYDSDSPHTRFVIELPLRQTPRQK